jgi:hypothetical protein
MCDAAISCTLLSSAPRRPPPFPTPSPTCREYSALLGEPRAASVVAVEFCELFALSR